MTCRISFTVELKHGLLSACVDECLGRFPWRHLVSKGFFLLLLLLFGTALGDLATLIIDILFLAFGIVVLDILIEGGISRVVASIFEFLNTQLHGIKKTDLFRFDHRPYRTLIRQYLPRLQSPHTLLAAVSVIL
ncbi:hypothetical protein HG531_008699 [Fusarium graminearum]|nr:hypothetical protein HG531_008699 [Fusarium graminearum]